MTNRRTEQRISTKLPIEGGAAGCWTVIRHRACRIVIEKRDAGNLAQDAAHLAADAPFERRAAGPVEAAVRDLGTLPPPLAVDIHTLALRFAALMNVPAVRLRLEGITTDACRKIHADYTDVRLITTCFGPGTDYIQASADPVEANLVRLSSGDIALFKGRLFGDDHEPCFHRSPPIVQTEGRRLVLVIDTPLDEAMTPQTGIPLRK